MTNFSILCCHTPLSLSFWIGTSRRVSQGEQWAKFTIYIFTPLPGTTTGTSDIGNPAYPLPWKSAEWWRVGGCVVPGETISKVLMDHSLTQAPCELQQMKPPKTWSGTASEGETILFCPSPNCTHFGKQQLELSLKSAAATNTINCILSNELSLLSSFSKHYEHSLCTTHHGRQCLDRGKWDLEIPALFSDWHHLFVNKICQWCLCFCFFVFHLKLKLVKLSHLCYRHCHFNIINLSLENNFFIIL